jgi:carbonic anhydrase/acetyltransferase-like protein (isoleucine patch superfamily)
VIHSYLGSAPEIDATAYLCASAEVIGNVAIGAESSVWFHAVIRGDVNTVRIGSRSNIQDGCLLHVLHEKGPLVVGDNVTVGHGAILHGCTVGDYCLIGMGAIVLDNARINSYTLLAAGSVVRPGTVIPGGVMAAGIPARVLRDLSPGERTMLEESAQHYVDYAKAYRDAT